jgi:4-hydroxy-4-methyl-2-oxoglutarate aldolase
VQPGDVVIGDDDGVVIVPRDDAATVLTAAKAREDKEARSRERYQRGELFLDMYDMRGELERLGLRYVDYEDARGREEQEKVQ